MASKRPDSDVWNIVDNDEMSQHYGRHFKFDFSYISSDEIKELFMYGRITEWAIKH